MKTNFEWKSLFDFPVFLRILGRFALAAVLLTFTCARNDGAVIQAASVSRSDVGAAVALAGDGDTVEIPAGTAAWSSTLTISRAITLKGAGVGRTIIQDSISGSGRIIAMNTVPRLQSRLTGVEFQNGTRTVAQADGAIFLNGNNMDGGTVRVDNCKFDRLFNFSILCNNAIGVIHGCQFEFNTARIGIYVYHNTWNGKLYGDGSWASVTDWSGSKWMVIEDNRFHNSNSTYAVIDAYRGARYVFRFNMVINGTVEAHGTDSTARFRGTRAIQIYNNTFQATSPGGWPINLRSGSMIVCSNIVTGWERNHIARLDAYRSSYSFYPWGAADGTSGFDRNAEEGVFDSGIASGGGRSVIMDSNKSWPVDSWKGYVLREVHRKTATGGALRMIKVAGETWKPNEWAIYMVTSAATGQRSRVLSNTADTLTLHNGYPAIDFTAGGDFELSRSSQILGNTSDTITVRDQGGYVTDYAFSSGCRYEIRKVEEALDQPGKGMGALLSGDIPNPIWLNQEDDPVYEWDNLVNGKNGTLSVGASFIRSGEHYFEDTIKPGWQPLPYPHPLIIGSSGDRINAPARLRKFGE